LKVFFDDSVRRWDEHYEALPTKIPSPLSLPSNLYHLFPNEFLPWLSWQSSKRKGKPENQFQTICGTQTHFTAVDLGCGLGNETLLNLMEWQLVRHEEDHRQRLDQEECGFFSSACLLGSPTVPVLNVHFIDASSEAINRLRDDPRYEHAANSNAEKWSPATITSQICDFASNQPTLDQSADIILLLFVLSAIGPYQRHHHQSGESLASGMLVRAVQHAANMLKHDGVILFQDYARYDDDQLREYSYFAFTWISRHHHANDFCSACI
jgi:SAM-dependent methyltransferase